MVSFVDGLMIKVVDLLTLFIICEFIYFPITVGNILLLQSLLLTEDEDEDEDDVDNTDSSDDGRNTVTKYYDKSLYTELF